MAPQKESFKKLPSADAGYDNSSKTSFNRMKGSIFNDIYYGEGFEEGGESNQYYIGVGSWGSVKSEPEIFSELEFRTLNLLESGSIVSVLEDLQQELLILKYAIGAPVVPSWQFKYIPLEERFMQKDEPTRTFPEVDSIPLLTTPLKLQRDRYFIETTVSETMTSLLEDGSFEPLYEAGQALKHKKEEEDDLLQEVKKNLEYMRNIKKSVDEKLRLQDMEEKQREELLYKLQDEIDDIILKCSIEEQFVDKWEVTRNAQNKLRLKNEEEFFRNNISDLEIKSELENRVNEEMVQYLKTNQMELEEQLEEWMTRYDTEMEKRENKILQLKYMTDQTEEEVKRLQNLYDTRQVEMREWLKFRNVRKRRTAASLLIQSWWRGLMVRKKLGPYKEKKQKQTDKNKDKKDNKNKKK